MTTTTPLTPISATQRKSPVSLLAQTAKFDGARVRRFASALATGALDIVRLHETPSQQSLRGLDRVTATARH